MFFFVKTIVISLVKLRVAFRGLEGIDHVE